MNEEFDFESIKTKALAQLKSGKSLLGKDGAFGGTSKNLCLSKYHRQSEQEELDINHSV